MFKMLTTSLALSAFASLALAQVTVTVTQTVLVSNVYTTYTATSRSTYTTDTVAPTPTSEPSSTSAPSSATAPSSTPSVATTTYSIQVGATGLTYTPSNITANVGDTVEFFFGPKNHTVTQSSFAQPCVPLPGLDTGFTNPTTTLLTNSTFSFVVNDTSALWFYCKQGTHCKSGMVFAVNANENRTFAAFLNNALNSGSSSSSTPSSTSGGTIGTGTGTGTADGISSATSTGSPSSSANGVSVNLGLTAVFAVVGGAILAL